MDPYYPIQKAQSVGYYPDILLACRRINDAMGQSLLGAGAAGRQDGDGAQISGAGAGSEAPIPLEELLEVARVTIEVAAGGR